MKKAKKAEIPTRCPAKSTDAVGHYAWNILHDRIIACQYVRLACERHFRDLAEGSKRGLTFDPAWARFAIEFFSLYLKHSKGEWGGQPVDLSDWQCFIVGSAFGWFRKNGTRRFRTIYLEIARKNGKSTLASGVGIYGLLADREPGAEIYCAATRKDQAIIIFSEAQRMIRASPDLRQKVGIFKYNLSVDQTASKFEPLSADDKTLDGLNPHFVLIDELHRHRTRAVLDVLDTALGARRQPLMLLVTTAGDEDVESVYATESNYAQKVVQGVIKDDSYLSFICTLDQGDDWTDPKVWKKANPGLGISVKMDDLKRQCDKAKQSPSAAVAFKRLRLNIRTSDSIRAINMEQWRRNSEGPFDPASLQGRDFYGALDLSSKIDLSAWIKLYPPINDETRWKIVCRFWMPSETVTEKSARDRVQYQRWISRGEIDATIGNIIDHNEIQNVVLEDCRQGQAISIAYDPWNAAQLAAGLAGSGLPMFEFVQGIRSYTAPTKELEAWLADGRLDHGDNEILAWMASNLYTQVDKNDNRMPIKKRSTGRIDGMTALIMCIGRSMLDDSARNLDGYLSSPLSF